MKKYLGLILCGAFILTGCVNEVKLSNGQEVVVEIDGKQFTAEELFEEMKTLSGTTAVVNLVDNYITDKEKSEELEKDAVERATAIVEQYKAYYGDQWNDVMTSSGYANEQEVIDDYYGSQLKSLVLEKYIATTLEEKDIEEYYEENIYGEMTVRHILIKPETTDSMTTEEKNKAKEDALAEAKLLINQLGEITDDFENQFAELAKEESDDTGSATEGGLISNFTNETGLVEEFFDASYELEVGDYTSTPVETEFGYHIIYKVSQNEKPAIDTVKDKITEALVTKLLSEDQNASYVYWAALREKYGMKIHDDILESEYNSVLATY